MTGLTEQQVQQVRDGLTYMAEHPGAVDHMLVVAERIADDARADMRVKIEALHAPYRIYDECGHEHTDEDFEAGLCVDAAEVGYVCDEGLLYIICRECCCDYDGFNYWQTESCVNGHEDHTRLIGPGLCATRALLADLGGEPQ